LEASRGTAGSVYTAVISIEEQKMTIEIPLKTFSGYVKQLETSFKYPEMEKYFNLCFSQFREIDEMYADLKRDGIENLSSAAGSEYNFGFRPRRFSGGPGLRPNSYFTICQDSEFHDYGTLRDEMVAYYSGSSGITVSIFDPNIETGVMEFLRESGQISEDDLKYPFYFIVYKIESNSTAAASTTGLGEDVKPGSSIAMTYGVRQYKVEIDKVVDLRDPETQKWFTDTFVALELQSEDVTSAITNVYFPAKKPINNFGELIPVILSLVTGGGIVFTQAIGQWLRKHDVRGLVFPSSRSNSFNKVNKGELIESGGWNLVLYAGAEAPIDVPLFGRMPVWRDPDHSHIEVNFVSDGSERGSFSVRGSREYNLLSFDLEKQIAAGVRESNPVATLTGSQQWALTQAVSEILEGDRARSKLWYNDVKYFDFVNWLEKQWRVNKRST
jgi:hypothetical protein